jgi:hypothetical protein
VPQPKSLRAQARARYRRAAKESPTRRPAAADLPLSGGGDGEAARGKGNFRATAQRKLGGWSDDSVTPLTAMARALYEGGVVPVRVIAWLCGVSVRTLYHHIKKRGWKRRKAAPVKGGARNKDRLRAARNARKPKAARGLAARDPQRQAAGLARAERALGQAEEARVQVHERHETEVAVRELAALAQALSALHGGGRRKPRRQSAAPAKAAPSRAAARAGSRYDLSPEETRAALLRRMNAVTVGRAALEQARPASAAMPPWPALPSPAADSSASPPEHASAHARKTELIIARLQGLRRRPW